MPETGVLQSRRGPSGVGIIESFEFIERLAAHIIQQHQQRLVGHGIQFPTSPRNHFPRHFQNLPLPESAVAERFTDCSRFQFRARWLQAHLSTAGERTRGCQAIQALEHPRDLRHRTGRPDYFSLSSRIGYDVINQLGQRGAFCRDLDDSGANRGPSMKSKKPPGRRASGALIVAGPASDPGRAGRSGFRPEPDRGVQRLEQGGGVAVRKDAHGYTLFREDDGKPLARLRPRESGDRFEVLYWNPVPRAVAAGGLLRRHDPLPDRRARVHRQRPDGLLLAVKAR